MDIHGNVLGRHKGIIHYTVGQRKGLGIAFGEPRFVLRLNMKDNEVVLGTNEDLMSKTVIVDDVNYMAVDSIETPLRATGKVRYSQKDVPCTIYPEAGGRVRAEFDEPVRAAAPGQSGVFYDGDNIICGGTII